MNDTLPEGLILKRAALTPLEAVEETAKGWIKGYASLFNRLDGDGDIMTPGCFDASLARHKAAGSMPLMFWQHRCWDVPIGAWKTAACDERGLLLEGQVITDAGDGRQIYEALKLGGLGGLSIGFFLKSFEAVQDTRHIREAELFECSLVNFPCMPGAQITAVKSAIPEARPFDPRRRPRLVQALAALTPPRVP